MIFLLISIKKLIIPYWLLLKIEYWPWDGKMDQNMNFNRLSAMEVTD